MADYIYCVIPFILFGIYDATMTYITNRAAYDLIMDWKSSITLITMCGIFLIVLVIHVCGIRLTGRKKVHEI